MLVPRGVYLDSKGLDNEVIELAKSKTLSALRYYNSDLFITKYQPELEVLLKFFIYRSTFGSNQPSPGQQTFGIKYASKINSALTKYYCFMIVITWCKERITSLTSLIRSAEASIKIAKMVEVFDVAYLCLDLFNFIRFIETGKFPTVLERLFRLNITSIDPATTRTVCYSYFVKEALWGGLRDFLITILSVIPRSQFQHIFKILFPNHFKSTMVSIPETKTINGETELFCIICKQLAIHPLTLECRHIACYYCLHSTLSTDNADFKCILCGHNSNNFPFTPKCLKN